jgi:endosialidase-like protein
MGNTHNVPDFASELQSTTGDLLPACVVSTSWPTIPVPPSLTLSAFATKAYVRNGIQLIYVEQGAHSVVLVGGDGQYWLAISEDTFSSMSGWNRTPGTFYLWRLSATRPPDVDGLLVFLSVTVSGGAITAVTPASGVTRAEALRALSGLGTMATQDASAVAISGGTATFSALTTQGDLYVQGHIGVGTGPNAAYDLLVQNAGRFQTSAEVGGNLGLGTTPQAAGFERVHMLYPQAAGGLLCTPSAGGTAYPIIFRNGAGGTVGHISVTDTGTAYNTLSDVRLKHAIATLTDALDRVRALRPVAFRWNADDSPGIGFLAHELQQTIPEAVTGEPDAVNDDGSIRPQGVDHSKLVPWLTAAVQDLAAQVPALTARIATLEEALGL